MVDAIYKLEQGEPVLISSFDATGMHAGFPSPAMDYIQDSIDLNDILIKNPDSTFIANITGPSMKDAGIADPSRIIIDRSLTPKNNDIIVAVVNGEFTVRRYSKRGNTITLKPCNRLRPDFKPILIDDTMELTIWGIVIQVLVDPKAVMSHDSVS